MAAALLHADRQVGSSDICQALLLVSVLYAIFVLDLKILNCAWTALSPPRFFHRLPLPDGPAFLSYILNLVRVYPQAK
jgi:hypothetical protein